MSRLLLVDRQMQGYDHCRDIFKVKSKLYVGVVAGIVRQILRTLLFEGRV